MNTIELFAGTCSFSKVARQQGHETFTIDNNPLFNVDLVGDILELKDLNIDNNHIFNIFCKINIFEKNIIWASPPCQTFSVASISTYWKGGKNAYIPKTEKCKQALKLLEHTIKLIAENKPKYWFIENPRGVMRKVIDKLFKKHNIGQYKRVTVTYCQYGDTRMKPTDIWTNFMEWKPKPMCHNGMSCHVAAPRGAKTGTQGLKKTERSVIPPQLFKEIFEQLKRCNK